MKKYTMPSLQEILMIRDKETLLYMMKAYRQKTEKQLLENSLFPIFPYTNTTLEDCNRFLAEIDHIYAILPKELKEIDLIRWKLIYENKEYDNLVDIMYNKTVFFKDKLFKSYVELQNKYSEIRAKINWETIGIIPTENTCGVLFAQYEQEPLVYTYLYTIPKIKPIHELLQVQLEYVDTWTYSYVNTFQSKKLEYIKRIPWYQGTPYCVVVSWNMPFPLRHTILPIVRLELPKIIKWMYDYYAHVFWHGFFY